MVYNYVVCWLECALFPTNWKSRSFSEKSKAKAFMKEKAIKMKKNNIKFTKPYFVVEMVQRTYFRKDVKVECVKGKTK